MNDFSKVIQEGCYREQLEALRDLLAERLERAFPRDAAGIAKQLAEVLAELETLGAEDEESFIDRLQRDRDNRRSGTN
ncbi:hypothetical protein [Micromonospora sp. NPDC049891]|uniref:hypothetical protein n=1 Tax=Micromonospora sp. NPDC049891 TaxID=3155655 RepID=UPI0033EC4B00